MKALVVIPARYGSTRFPGKPLAMIGNQSMIQRVWQQVRKATNIDRIVVATDDERILGHVLEFGGEARMTSKEHTSGTDRCAELARQLESEGYLPDIIINVQGDEPFLHPNNIRLLIGAFQQQETSIATLRYRITDENVMEDPAVVKVVVDQKSDALYFSRYPIPYQRDPNKKSIRYGHMGVYAFRASILQELCLLPSSDLEKAENLEQLRWLEQGYQIKVVQSSNPSRGIDNPWDIDNFASSFPEV